MISERDKNRQMVTSLARMHLEADVSGRLQREKQKLLIGQERAKFLILQAL